MDKNISFTLKIWRQNGPKEQGHFDTFQMKILHSWKCWIF